MNRWQKLLGLGLLGSAGALLVLSAPLSTGESQGRKTVRILSTASIRGEVVPCG